jgi:hypothetical protein
MDFQDIEQLGDADLTICGLRIWIHGRQFPQASDYWDANWLRVTAYCISTHSIVRIQDDPCIHLGELNALLDGCERMYATLQGRAELQCMEPGLSVTLTASGHGHIDVHVSMTPNASGETHLYEDQFDQSYLPPIIQACHAILATFPIIDPDGIA